MAHQALVNWIDSLTDYECPSEIKQKLLDVINRDGLELGQPPFHTKKSAGAFFATMFGQRTNQSNAVASLAYSQSTKQVSAVILRRISFVATQENRLYPGERFVNRQEVLQHMARGMTQFMTFVREKRTDLKRGLPSFFSAGMFGWGKTELGNQAILQFNEKEEKLLHSELEETIDAEQMTIDAERLKSAWLCYVDMEELDSLESFASGMFRSSVVKRY